MKKIVHLSVVKNERAKIEGTRIRGLIGDSIRSIRAHLGDDLCGYGLVAWARDGRIVTSIVKTPNGPIGLAVVPTFIKDKLEQHATEDFIICSINAPPPEPAS